MTDRQSEETDKHRQTDRGRQTETESHQTSSIVRLRMSYDLMIQSNLN